MVVHVLEALLHTPEISEVYVVGDAIRLERAIARHGCLQLGAASACPIHIVPQRETLYENVWHTFLRTLPPGTPNQDHTIVIVPSDIPLLVPEELSDFLRQATALDADYVAGITPKEALEHYAPHESSPGIEMASFCWREGRFRPSPQTRDLLPARAPRPSWAGLLLGSKRPDRHADLGWLRHEERGPLNAFFGGVFAPTAFGLGVASGRSALAGWAGRRRAPTSIA